MKLLEWDEYYMANVSIACQAKKYLKTLTQLQAFLAALRSKDPATKVGACIVNKDKKIVGIGYNGFPIGCKDEEFPWSKDTVDPLQSKYLYVCHAEVNAILNKSSADTKGCRIYCALFPCNGCAKMIIQSRIEKVIYFSDKHGDKPSTIASKKLLGAAGVECIKMVPSSDGPIEIDFFDLHHIGNLQLHGRTNVCWTDYFMATAILASYRSKVANNQMGACIINDENKIVGIGYNGLPINCNYDDFSYSTASDRDLYFCHAEMNAVTNKNCESVKNCIMYVMQFPCSECAKILIQTGIKKIYYLNHESFDSVDAKAACKMFDAVGMEYFRYEMTTSKIVIDFTVIDK